MVDAKCAGNCWPLIIYITLVVIQLITIIFGEGSVVKVNGKEEKLNKTQTALATLVWGALWAYLIYYLCKHCHNNWAWAVLFLPVILAIGIIVLGLLVITSA